MQVSNWKRWGVALATLGALAGCGGDKGDDDTSTPPAVQPGGGSATKVLFIGVDGLTYDAVSYTHLDVYKRQA